MNTLIHALKNLPNEYKPIPFWSWNDRLDPAELCRQIRWMHSQGIGGFFMHARGGLKTEYLSDEWMQAVAVCCEEAKKMQMQPWIYDENGWPSGFAGGKLLEEPENRDMYLQHTIGSLDPDADVSYCIDGDELLRTAKEVPGSQYLNVYLRRSASTADILNPKVVNKFIQSTHEHYKAYFEGSFSEKVAGFFTDEPQYYRADTPYTTVLAEYFLTKYNEDILDRLGLLFVEKQGYRDFRYRYWLAMQDLMLTGFAKQVYQWCSENGVKLTGHYVEETTLGAQIMCCAGVMPFYEYEHIPGIDWLGKWTDNELSPRQLGSAARQLGKPQTLTETFACCGWNVTPAELKRIAGFQYACGVNMMCHHLLPYSEHGQRKRDYPAHFNPINPWVEEHFKDLNDYFSRLGYLLSNGEEPVNVALLHPIRSAYFDYKRNSLADDGFPGSDMEIPLRNACRTLSSRGIAYHFLDETLLEKHGFTDGAFIGCGKCRYTYLVLPKLLTMGKHTEKILRHFVKNGGKILLLDEPPAFLEGFPHDYPYLKSNCTLSEIEDAQPFTVDCTDTELYYAYRDLDEKPLLFVQNASDRHNYTQTFTFRENYTSLLSLDLNTWETKTLPLTVTLEKNESLLLFPSHAPAPKVNNYPAFNIRFNNAAAEFSTNFLTLDAVRYSKDDLNYSEPILCSTLCQQLLQDQYQGNIHLRYEFLIKTIPQSMHLLMESGNSTLQTINGIPLPPGKPLSQEPCVCVADISSCLKEGVNCFETIVNWHQSDATYYALFGEGVTESLKNCIAYDSEIEAIYLSGHFGVYSSNSFTPYQNEYLIGQNFYIGQPPERITEPVTDGLPFFRGDLTLSQNLHLKTKNVRISLPGDYLTAKVFVNDHYAGEICFNASLDISHFAHIGENTLRVTFTLSNRNLLGPFHSLQPEVFVDPPTFERNDMPTPDDGHYPYKFHRFYTIN